MKHFPFVTLSVSQCLCFILLSIDCTYIFDAYFYSTVLTVLLGSNKSFLGLLKYLQGKFNKSGNFVKLYECSKIGLY